MGDVQPIAPKDHDDKFFFRRHYGYSTLDDIALALAERTGVPAASIRKRIEKLDPDAVWDRYVGPMLDDIELGAGISIENEPCGPACDAECASDRWPCGEIKDNGPHDQFGCPIHGEGCPEEDGDGE